MGPRRLFTTTTVFIAFHGDATENTAAASHSDEAIAVQFEKDVERIFREELPEGVIQGLAINVNTDVTSMPLNTEQ